MAPQIISPPTSQDDEIARHKLLQRMQRRYPLRTRIISVADLELPITVVADPDQVLLEMEQGVQAAGKDEPRWQPYWAESWESAVALGITIAAWPLHGQRMLDLGCGVGLAGIVAAARGAQVVLADAARPAMLFARYNAWPWRERVTARCVDWRNDRLQRQFDVILGADILYDPADWPYLDEFWRAHLAPHGCVLLGEPGRRGADAWMSWCQAHGWRSEFTQVPVAQRPKPIRVYRLSRPATEA